MTEIRTNNKDNKLVSIPGSVMDIYVPQSHGPVPQFFNIVKYIKTATESKDIIVGSPQIISNTDGSITVRIPYYIRTLGRGLNTVDIITIQNILEKQLGVSVTLWPVRLTEPYLDAIILARYISDELVSQSFVRVYNRIMPSCVYTTRLFAASIPLPSNILGLFIKLDGRLAKETSRPRKTKQIISFGSLSAVNGSITQIGSHTTSNYKGSYTVSVWLCSHVT
jgi:hypothetical protein